MKAQTLYNRIERRIYTFDESDIMRALQERVKQAGLTKNKPEQAVSKWTLVIDSGDEGSKPSVILTEVFEYPTSESAE